MFEGKARCALPEAAITSPMDLSDRAQEKIVTRLGKLYSHSQRHMEQMYGAWNRADAQYVAYLGDEEKTATGRLVGRNPYAKRIYIPYTLANIQSTLAYMLQVFAGPRPYINLQARGGEVKATARMTAVLDAQAEAMNYSMLLYSFLLDGLKYGVGVMQPLWRRTFRKMPVTDPLMAQVLGTTSMEIDFDGPMTYNIDPFRYFPDPMAPLGDPQAGEYVTFEHQRSYQHLLRMQRGGVYAGVERVKGDQDASGSRSSTRGLTSERDAYRGLTSSPGIDGRAVSAGISMDGVREWGVLRETWAKILPAEWGVGTGEDEEIWCFTTYNDRHLIRAHRSPYPHGKLPVVVWEPNFDRHSAWNPGISWMVEGLQDMLNWLFNSHMESVRQSLNAQVVVDPMRIEVDDMLRPQPGRIIRKKGEWDGPLDSAYSQLKFQDTTSTHNRDINQIMEFMQRVTAVGDNQMGIASTDRKTAAEARIVAGASQGRMALLTQVASAQGLRPLVEMWVQNNQAFLSVDREYRVVGEKQRYRDVAEGITNGLIRVSRDQIQGFMDMVIHDGSLPVDPSQSVSEWREIFGMVSSNQVLMKSFNITNIFRELVNAMPGARKSVDDLVLHLPQTPVSVVPDNLNRVPSGATAVPTLATYGGST